MSNSVGMIVMYVVIFGLFIYLLMVRPARKRTADQQQMMSAIQPDARVMLATGMFGTVRAMGDKQAVVELAPGVEVTVLKQAITRVLNPDEEEFEYADAPQPGETGADTPAEGAADEDEVSANEPAVETTPATSDVVSDSVSNDPAASHDSAEFWADLEKRMHSPDTDTPNDSSSKH